MTKIIRHHPMCVCARCESDPARLPLRAVNLLDTYLLVSEKDRVTKYRARDMINRAAEYIREAIVIMASEEVPANDLPVAREPDAECVGCGRLFFSGDSFAQNTPICPDCFKG